MRRPSQKRVLIWLILSTVLLWVMAVGYFSGHVLPRGLWWLRTHLYALPAYLLTAFLVWTELRSWQLRFSLRTLILFQLLLTSAVGLVLMVMGGPWREEYVCHSSSILWSAELDPLGRGGPFAAGDDGMIRVCGEGGNDVDLAYEHGGPVLALEFSPDGKRLATASADKKARVWDRMESDADPLVLEGHHEPLTDIAWSPDGRTLATASKDWTVCLWDAVTGKCVRTLFGHKDSVESVAFSPDGRRLATASRDTTARIWNIDSGDWEEVFTTDGDFLHAVAFSPDGALVAAGGSRGVARVWDVAGGGPVHVLRGHEDKVYDVAWSPDGERMATASIDGKLRIWNSRTMGRLVEIEAHRRYVLSARFSADGRRIITSGDDGTARVWVRVRPEAWWGVALRPEPWLVAFFYGLLMWSLMGDKARIRRAMSATEQLRRKHRSSVIETPAKRRDRAGENPHEDRGDSSAGPAEE